jgi:pimeloyl-ACP methyl ester carboxylesterase
VQRGNKSRKLSGMAYANVQGTRLWFTDAGRGPPLLLVHAFPVDGRLWEGVVPHLLPHRRVFTVDLRGFGNSDESGAFSVKQMACDLAALLRLTGLPPVDAAGCSMGGYVLQELLRQDGERVKHLILVDSKAESDTVEAQNKRNAMAALAREKGAAAVADQVLPTMLRKTPDPAVVARLREIIASQRPETIAHAAIALRDREDFVALLSDADIPVSIIVGGEDAVTPPTAAKALAQRVKIGRCMEIEHAGHLSPLEQPAAVAAALLSLTDLNAV